MIVFHENGTITGYQTFPTTYSGPSAYIVVPDGTNLTGKKVSGGALADKTQGELDAEAAAALSAQRESISVSRFQALAALSNAGLLATAQAAVDAAGGVTKLAFDNALEFRRMSPTVLAMAQALSLTDQQLDDLFTAAAGIEA